MGKIVEFPSTTKRVELLLKEAARELGCRDLNELACVVAAAQARQIEEALMKTEMVTIVIGIDEQTYLLDIWHAEVLNQVFETLRLLQDELPDLIGGDDNEDQQV